MIKLNIEFKKIFSYNNIANIYLIIYLNLFNIYNYFFL